MNRVSLNFIAKNESHIVERMLTSALPIIDMIVAVDTGSTDDTIDKIFKFGTDHSLPTFVYSRPFDNFCNSRNYALEKLMEEAKKTSWNLDEMWGLTGDCDEWFTFLPGFRKEDLWADFYVIRQRIGRESYTRNGLFKLSKEFTWESPIHETLVYSDTTIRKEYEFNIELQEENAGASWKGDLEQKFLRYAEVLLEYEQSGHGTFRTIFFIADSFNAAASYSKDSVRKARFYELASEYFDRALRLEPKNPEIRFMLWRKIAENRAAMGKNWNEIQDAYLVAFLECPVKAESIAPVIEHYIDIQEWELAYMYSLFAYLHFVKEPMTGDKKLFNDESLYQWRLLFCYYYTAYRSNRKKEAKVAFKTLSNIQLKMPAIFTREDLTLIAIHTPWALKVSELRNTLATGLKQIFFGNTKVTPKLDEQEAQTKKRIYYAV